MHVSLLPCLKTDILNVIFQDDGSPRKIYESAIDEIDGFNPTQMLKEGTEEVVGWIVYDFAAQFEHGKIWKGFQFPPTDLCFEIDDAPGRSFTLPELLQWAYDNLVPAEMKKAA